MAQISRKWIEDGAVDHTKIDSTDSYTLGGLTVIGGAAVGGILGVSETVMTQDLSVVGDSTVAGNAQFTGTVGGTANFGIGVTVPTSRTDIQSDSTTDVLKVFASSSAFSSSVNPPSVIMSSTAIKSTYNNLFLGKADSTRVFRVSSLGQIYASSTTIFSPADFAEWTHVTGDVDDYEEGDVVMQDPFSNKYVTKIKGNSPVYGIVTNRATFCGIIDEAHTDESVKVDFMQMDIEELENKYSAKRIAMTGHVLCKVFGEIRRGSLLCTSNMFGIACAVCDESLPEYTKQMLLSFAIAREDFSGNKVGLIEVRLK